MKSYRFRLYPSKAQERQLNTHLWLAKNLWNDLLEHSKETYRGFDKFPTRNSLQLMVKNTGLFSQAAQEIAHRVEAGIWRYVRLRKAGKKAGFPRFKSIDRMRSLHYPQFGFSIGKKLKVTPFGEISIVKHRQIEGKVKTLTLKRESSGKWFAIFYSDSEKLPTKANGGPAAGIDMGLEQFATLSDGGIIRNPRHLWKRQDKLALFQRHLSKKRKGSKNRQKARLKVARVHEKVTNCRHDFLHKTANALLSRYSLIAIEDLHSQELSSKGHGKGIHDAAWKMFANILAYKAGSAGCNLVFVNPENTSKECSACGAFVQKTLWDRQHNCHNCGLVVNRDLNASINILKRATAGIAGSNACGDEAEVSSLKQEAHESK